MNRREFSQLAGLAVLAGARPAAAAADGTPTLYFVDGYHGGAIGHMPPGAWRDILNTLREIPKWKLCLDIEPISWDLLKQTDPEALEEWKQYLSERAVNARIEMVGATFAQPYGWAISGESNIRQLTRGLEVIRRHFPSTPVVTYAVQEPCWASCLPQILRSLGFGGAVLKDPGTAWGGYAAGYDAETVHWIGPDGTSITTVPRYACEGLQKVYETEAATATREYARKCVAHGIPHPTGMYFQDLGWAAKPKVSGDYIEYVTWREYLEKIADKPKEEWRFGIEDILTTLPWGEKTLQTVGQQVRSAENRLVAAEKMAAMAWMEAATPWPAESLQQAWDKLLYAQAHDAWITATTRTGRQAWAFQVAAGTMETEEFARKIIETSTSALLPAPKRSTGTPLGPQTVRVFNTLGCARNDVTELVIATDRGTSGIRVLDRAGKEVPAQVAITRQYTDFPGRPKPDGTVNAANVVFEAKAPAFGFADYKIEPLHGAEHAATDRHAGSPVFVQPSDNGFVIESDLYRLSLDAKRGGTLMSFFSKALQKEFAGSASGRLFHEYRGYFAAQKEWHSSAENPARISIVENGPLRARVRIAGKVGTVPFQTTITVVAGQRRVEFQTRLTYTEDTWIGDPWDIKPEDRRSERRRSQNDGRWKLQALFPVPFESQSIFKNAAFDVCKSRNQNTFFQRWDEIKHNILVNWVDVADEKQQLGLAVLSDHTTAYSHGPDHPLALVLGWGGEGGFWWGKCPLRGVQNIGYALIPHQGTWEEAGLWEEMTRWHEPLHPQLVEDASAPGKSQSLVSVSGRGVEVTTALVHGNALLIRLFHAEGGDSNRVVSLAHEPARVESVKLDGTTIEQLPIRRAAQGRFEVSLPIPRFGIRTLRCTFKNTSTPSRA